MLCPTCVSERLVMSERSGIEIDYCPQCRGVWLDRGELDKLIERSATQSVAPAPMSPQPSSAPPPPPVYRRKDDDDDDDWKKHGKHRKKKGLLGEIFDF